MKGPGAVFRTYGIVTICLSLTSVAMCKFTPVPLPCVALLLGYSIQPPPVRIERKPGLFSSLSLFFSYPPTSIDIDVKRIKVHDSPTNNPLSSLDIFGKRLRRLLSEQKWLGVIGAVRPSPGRVASEGASH